MAIIKNCYPNNPFAPSHPQWRHFGLGVLVWNGKLKKEDVVSWQPNSPAANAFAEGYEACERIAIKARIPKRDRPFIEQEAYRAIGHAE